MRVRQFSVVGTLRRCSHESTGNVETRSIRMDLIGTARPRLDFSHLAKAGKISGIARLPKPTTPQPKFLARRIGDRQRLLRQGFLQQRTGNICLQPVLARNLVMKPAASDFLFRSFRHSLIPRYFEFRCLWISSNRRFRYSRYSCCNLGSLGEP